MRFVTIRCATKLLTFGAAAGVGTMLSRMSRLRDTIKWSAQVCQGRKFARCLMIRTTTFVKCRRTTALGSIWNWSFMAIWLRTERAACLQTTRARLPRCKSSQHTTVLIAKTIGNLLAEVICKSCSGSIFRWTEMHHGGDAQQTKDDANAHKPKGLSPLILFCPHVNTIFTQSSFPPVYW
jgi:hypothetical protein